MFKRLLLAFGLVLVAATGAAVFAFYSPEPPLPAAAATVDRLTVDGRSRRYAWVAPAARPGASILLVLHPSQGSGEGMRRIVGHSLEALAARENVIVVYPDGVEGHFNDCRRAASYSARQLGIDDVAFLRAVVEQLVTQQQADRHRVYAIGYSNGGHMAMRLALEAPGLLHGFTAIAANFPTEDNLDCERRGPPPPAVQFIAGTDDPINPYAGGPVTLFGFGHRGDVVSAVASAEAFAQGRSLAPQPPRPLQACDDLPLLQQDWLGVAGRVRLLSIEGGGHTVPQATYRYPRAFGATCRSDAVLQSAWAFMASAP